MPHRVVPIEGECPPCREPPYRACPYRARAPTPQSRSQGKQSWLGAWGFIGPMWSQSHPTPGGHVGEPAPGPAKPFAGEEGGDCSAQSPVAHGGHNNAPPTSPCPCQPPLRSPHALEPLCTPFPAARGQIGVRYPGFGMNTGQRSLCKAAAAPAPVPLCRGLGFLNEGWPGPQRSRSGQFHNVFWSVLTRRGHGEGCGGGGIPVNSL